MTQAKTGKQVVEGEFAGAVDPFAVDFFGPSRLISDDEAPVIETARVPVLTRRDRSNWHRLLPRLTNREAELSNLLRFLPANFEDLSTASAATELSRHLFRDKVSIELISTSETGVAEALSGRTSRPRVFLTGSEARSGGRFTGFFDVELANRIIDLVLDGPKDDFAARRHLSSTEQVIIEYLTGRVLTAVNSGIDGPRFVIDSIGETAPAGFGEFERGVELVFRLQLEDYENIVTLILPSAILDSLIPALWGGRLSFAESTSFETEFRVAIGSTTLDGASLACLEKDDFVLFDRLLIEADGKPVGSGPAVFVGSGNGLRLRGKIEENGFNGKWLFHLDEIVGEPLRRVFSPARFNMDNEAKEEIEETAESTAEDPETEDGSDLSPALENIQVGLRVEIAGSRVSLREIQELRAGQIIALGCGPNDPVRLAVEGSSDPVASGELVDIEGQLGIRLTKVFV